MTLTRTVLLVDDDDDVRELIRMALERAGHTVIEAATSDEALTRFATDGGRIDLLLTDVAMPGGTGPNLYRRLSATQPALPVLFMSGCPDHDGIDGAALIEKPFTMTTLVAQVSRVACGEPPMTGAVSHPIRHAARALRNRA